MICRVLAPSALLAGVALGGAACHDRPPHPAPETAPVVFVPDGPPASPDGPALFLRGHVEGARVLVDVVVSGVAELHGLAFRVRFDPAALAYADASASSAWSRQALRLAKEPTPGEVAVVWTEKGTSAPLLPRAGSETTLGSLEFTLAENGEGDAALAFRPDHSKAIDSTGRAIPVGWRGGHTARTDQLSKR